MTSPFKNTDNSKPVTTEKKRLSEAGRSGGVSLGLHKRGATKLGSIDIPDSFRDRISTGYSAIDQFLSDGGGLCPIQSITITAPRGGGKTTLWLQLLQGMFSSSNGEYEGLYGSGEEYVEQLALAAERTSALDVCADNMTLVEDYIEEIETGRWKAIVVDSLPSLTTNMRLLDGRLVRKSEVSAADWKESSCVPKSQVEELAVQTMVSAGKSNSCVTVFILHLTKGGQVKGNSSIEHTVDTCLKIVVPTDNDIEKGLYPYGCKLIQCDKNRFGGTGTVAAKMGRKGWDLDNLIDLAGCKPPDNNKATPGGQRAEKKVREMNAIVDYMESNRDKRMTAQEILGNIKMPTDATAFDRHERHLKALARSGRILKFGGGTGVKNPAVYEIAPKK